MPLLGLRLQLGNYQNLYYVGGRCIQHTPATYGILHLCIVAVGVRTTYSKSILYTCSLFCTHRM